MRIPGPETAGSSQRMCVGCRTRRHPSELLRFVGHDGGLRVDLRRRLGGRGLNLCPDPACIDQAMKRRVWGRALRTHVHCERSVLVTDIAEALRRDIGQTLTEGRRTGDVCDTAPGMTGGPSALEALRSLPGAEAWLPPVTVGESWAFTRLERLASALSRFTLEGAGAMKARAAENG